MTAALPPLSLDLVRDLTDMLSHDFMRHAFAAGGAIALAAGMAGYFIVLRNQVFSSDALGHVAFSGGLAGLVAGIPLSGAVFASTMGGSLAMGSLGGRGRSRDVATGTVFASVLGLGVLFLSLYTTGRSGTGGLVGASVLFGSILGLAPGQADTAVVAGLLVSLGMAAIARPLLFLSVDPDVAITRGVPVRAVTVFFLVLVGAAVAEAVQAVGALLIFSLLVTPAAVSQNLTARPYLGIGLSACLAVTFTWVGLTLAFYLPYPASFLITALAFAAYIGSVLYARGTRR